MFGRTQAVFLDVGDEVVELIAEEDGDAEEAADPDGEEGQAEFAEVEVVEIDVDEGEDFEEGIVDAVG